MAWDDMGQWGPGGGQTNPLRSVGERRGLVVGDGGCRGPIRPLALSWGAEG